MTSLKRVFWISLVFFSLLFMNCFHHLHWKLFFSMSKIESHERKFDCVYWDIKKKLFESSIKFIQSSLFSLKEVDDLCLLPYFHIESTSMLILHHAFETIISCRRSQWQVEQEKIYKIYEKCYAMTSLRRRKWNFKRYYEVVKLPRKRFKGKLGWPRKSI